MSAAAERCEGLQKRESAKGWASVAGSLLSLPLIWKQQRLGSGSAAFSAVRLECRASLGE